MLKRLLGLIVCLFVLFQSNPSFAADGNAQECVPQETSKEKKIESIESKIKDLNTLSGDGKDAVIEKLQTFAKGIDDGSFGAKSKDVRKILKAVDKAAED
ncbi:MAG: hypothetical protein VX278_03680, partial [Myxococcota bacterium]|nr:hypothetical protein [Myxococcota bacterium]